MDKGEKQRKKGATAPRGAMPGDEHRNRNCFIMTRIELQRKFTINSAKAMGLF